MGRKKIVITPITDERNRHVTFNKRRQGLVKKAYELSVLASCDVALIVFDPNGKPHQYCNRGIGDVLRRFIDEHGADADAEDNETVRKKVAEKDRKKALGPAAPPPERAERAERPRGHTRPISDGGESLAPPQHTAASLAAISAYPSATPGASALAAAAAAQASTVTSRRPTNTNLTIAIPGTDPKMFPPGTRPRLPQQQSIGPLPSLSSFLSDISGQPLALPSFSLNLGNSFSLPPQSPTVLHTTRAGDLFLSNSVQQATQKIQRQASIGASSYVSGLAPAASAAGATNGSNTIGATSSSLSFGNGGGVSTPGLPSLPSPFLPGMAGLQRQQSSTNDLFASLFRSNSNSNGQPSTPGFGNLSFSLSTPALMALGMPIGTAGLGSIPGTANGVPDRTGMIPGVGMGGSVGREGEGAQGESAAGEQGGLQAGALTLTAEQLQRLQQMQYQQLFQAAPGGVGSGAEGTDDTEGTESDDSSSDEEEEDEEGGKEGGGAGRRGAKGKAKRGAKVHGNGGSQKKHRV